MTNTVAIAILFILCALLAVGSALYLPGWYAVVASIAFGVAAACVAVIMADVT